MQSKPQYLKNIFNNLLSLIYPAKCIACAKVLNHGTPLHICKPCLSKFEFADERVYGEFDFDYARAFFEYNDILRGIILDIKFGKKAHKMVSLANIAVSLAQEFGGEYEGFDSVVPVPLHAKRLKERGFNQAKVLAEVIAEGLNLPMDNNICIRKVDTMPQSMMDRENRRDNVADVFAIADGIDVSGKRFVLVDDVFTSGETLNSLAAVFKASGAESVVCICVCIAHTKARQVS